MTKREESKKFWGRKFFADDAKWAWLFLAPCFLGLLIFTYIPTGVSFWLSFNYWNLLGAPEFVGLANYRGVLADPLFWKTFLNTVVFVAFTAFFEVALGLLVAVWLNRVMLVRALLRTAYFLPVITPMVSVALVWGWIYEPEYGVLNWGLVRLGVLDQPVAWLYNTQTALGAVIVLQVWKMLGYNVVIFLAGLQMVPDSVYESAELDGASPWKTFWRITFPMITPTVFFLTTISMINAFQVFDSIYLLTQGGPAHSTELLVYWMFKNAFQFYKIGPASAIAYIVFVVILALTLIQWQLRKRWVMYEDEMS